MKTLRALAVLAATLLTVAACSGGSSGGHFYSYHSAQATGTFIPSAQRKPVHPFSGPLLSGGGQYNLAKYDGQVVVVNFWGAWCAPCRTETPQFGQVYDSYQHKGVTFVGIDVKDGDRSEPRQFLAANHVIYPVIYDEDGRTAITMGNLSTLAVPMTVLLDKQHRVAAVYVTPLTPKDLDPALNKLIAEPGT